MTIPRISTVELAGSAEQPLLLVGPSLGTAVQPLWQPVAELMADRWHVVGWDLPGHGSNRDVVDTTTLPELARGVLAAVDEPEFSYAGDSVGGAVGLHLLLDAPQRVTAAVLCCTGAKIGTAEAWQERAALVRREGTGTQVAGSRERWFGPGFVEREPAVAQQLLDSLAAADGVGYAAVCDALAGHDVRDRLSDITQPVLAIAGSHDGPTPPEQLQQIADGVQRGRCTVLDGVGHLAPAEAPRQVADLIRAALG